MAELAIGKDGQLYPAASMRLIAAMLFPDDEHKQTVLIAEGRRVTSIYDGIPFSRDMEKIVHENADSTLKGEIINLYGPRIGARCSGGLAMIKTQHATQPFTALNRSCRECDNVRRL